MIDDHRELAFLQRLALAAASARDPGDLMQIVIAETTEALGVAVCSIFVLDQDGEHLRFTATNGLSEAGVGRVALRVGEGLTGSAAREMRPIAVDDVSADARFRWLPGVDQSRLVSMCSVPIISADRLVGVLNVQTERPRHFAAPDIGLLEAIAAQVAGVLERAELQRRLETRLRELQLSNEIHRRLSHLALSGAGLEAICQAMERYTGAPVAVYDGDGTRLAASSPDRIAPALRGFVDPERREDGLLVAPVRAGADSLGWLAVGPVTGRGATARAQAIEHGLTVVALHLIHERAEAETESRLRGGLLQELLTADLGHAEARRLARRAARLGYRIRAPLRVLIIEPDDGDAAHALSSAANRRRAIRALDGLLARARPGGLVVEQGPDIALLLPDDGHSLEDSETLAEKARAAVSAAAAGASVSAGLSADAGGPEELSRLARQAREAVRVGRSTRDTAGAVHSHARLGVERLLLQVERRHELTGYVEEWLGPLERHERAGRAAAPLITTLEMLVERSWNLRAAARELHVHVNTLLYRIGRIEELTGRALDDPDTRMALGLALKARRLTGLEETYDPEPVANRVFAPYPFGIERPSVPEAPATERTA